MARKAPAFQFYADDFLAGTLTLTPEEVGIYIRLLCLQWSQEVLMDDAGRLAIAVGTTPEKVATVLEMKFEKVEGGWRNARLATVHREQAEYRERQANAAKKRWQKKPSDSDSDSDSLSDRLAIDQKEAEEINEIQQTIFRHLPPPNDGDKLLAWRVAVLVAKNEYSLDWLYDSLEGTKQGSRKKKPWAYFQSCLRDYARQQNRDIKADFKRVPRRKSSQS